MKRQLQNVTHHHPRQTKNPPDIGRVLHMTNIGNCITREILRLTQSEKPQFTES